MERPWAFHSCCRSYSLHTHPKCPVRVVNMVAWDVRNSAAVLVSGTRARRPSALPRKSARMAALAGDYQPYKYKDVQYATLLSEMAYRAVECGDEASWKSAKQFIESEVGCSLPDVQRHKSGGQRYLVAETENAVYVAFQGTKHVTDWLANLNFIHAPVWHRHTQAHSSRRDLKNAQSWSSSSSSSYSNSNAARAHVGFIRRANQSALSISAVHQSAAAAGKRLVLTGHSLGGAVATLTTVQLLRSLHTSRSADGSSSDSSNDDDPQIRCISFATPAVANTSLLQEVTEAGWDKYITNIVLPEDPVVPFVNLLLKAPAYPQSALESTAQPCSSPLAKATTDAFAAVSMAMNSSTAALSRSSSSSSFSLEADLYAKQQAAGVLEAAGTACWVNSWKPHSKLGHFNYAAQVSPRSLTPCAALSAAVQSSDELAGWLAVARDAAQQQRQSLSRCFSADSTDLRYCYSSSSLQSMQSGVSESSSGWSASDSVASLTSYTGRLEADLQAACSASRQLTNSNTLDSTFPSSDAVRPSYQETASRLTQRIYRFSFSKASLAMITGALAAGMRCAAALAAPQLLSQHPSLVSLLPGVLSTPLAVVAVQLMGTWWLKSALPVTHPLGQQFVMTGSGMEQVAKPLKAYPKAAQDLGLQQLGGFAPGHRMIAYRRRLVNLMQKQSLQ